MLFAKRPEVKAPMEKEKQKKIHTAASEGDVETVLTMLRLGHSPDLRNRHGRTPLMGAAYYGHIDVAIILLFAGADINARCKDGATALIYATVSGQTEMVSFLLGEGAQREIKTKDELTARDVALSKNRKHLADILDARDMLGLLPQEVAIQVLGYLDVSSVLNASLVSKTWNRLANDKLIWRRLCAQHGWARSEVTMLSQRFDLSVWKYVYAERNTLLRRWKQGHYRSVILKDHNADVFCLKVHSDIAVSGSKDRTLKVWRCEDQALLATLTGHANSVVSAEMDPDYIYSGDAQGALKVWSRHSYELLCNVEHAHGGMVSALAVNDQFFVSASFDCTIKCWHRFDGRDLRLIRVLTAHGGDIYGIKLQGSLLVSGSFDRSCRIWDLSVEGDSNGALLFRHPDTVTSVEADENLIVTACLDKSLRVFQRSTRKLIKTISVDTWGKGLCLTNSRLLYGDSSGIVRAWELPRLQPLFTTVVSPLITAIQADEERIMVSSRDSTITVLDFAADRRQLQEHFSSRWLHTPQPLWNHFHVSTDSL